MVGIRYFVYENGILPANRLKTHAMAGFYSGGLRGWCSKFGIKQRAEPVLLDQMQTL
jgi:hypothetical protein